MRISVTYMNVCVHQHVSNKSMHVHVHISYYFALTNDWKQSFPLPALHMTNLYVCLCKKIFDQQWDDVHVHIKEVTTGLIFPFPPDHYNRERYQHKHYHQQQYCSCEEGEGEREGEGEGEGGREGGRERKKERERGREGDREREREVWEYVCDLYCTHHVWMRVLILHTHKISPL